MLRSFRFWVAKASEGWTGGGYVGLRSFATGAIHRTAQLSFMRVTPHAAQQKRTHHCHGPSQVDGRCASSPRPPWDTEQPLICRVLRREVALAARRFAFALALPGHETAVCLSSSLLSGEFAPLLPAAGFACKGVFITLGALRMLPPCSPVLMVAASHRAKNSGKRRPARVGGQCQRNPQQKGSESRNPAFV